MGVVKQEVAEKRAALAQKQNELNDTACKLCPKRIGQWNVPLSECVECPALAQLRDIGEQLCALTNKRRAVRIESIYKKALTMVSVEEYHILNAVHTDCQIAKHFNVYYNDFVEWKKIAVYGK